MGFQLDPQLQKDTLFLKSMVVSDCLLMNDARFPWLILVPRIDNISEWHELETKALQDINQEIQVISSRLKRTLNLDKMNIASLGNQVKQLHIHVIGRRISDEAWPKPVWGCGSPIPYSKPQTMINSLLEILQ